MATVAEALSIALDHHLAGRTAEAETLYRRILDAAPDQPDALHLLGMLLAQNGRPAEGLAALDAAVRAAPANPAFHLNRAKLLLALDRGGEAADSLHAALVNRPDLAEAAALLASVLRVLAERAFDAGDMDRAARLYRKALALAPSDHAALFDLAMTVKRLGRIVDAARILGRVGRIVPGLLRAHAEEAEAWRAAGRADRAAAARRRAVAAQPLDPGLRLGLALALQTAGATAAAVAAYRAALALDPANGGGWNNLGVALRTLGRAAGAAAVGRWAARVAPERADALLNLAAAELAVENPRAAVAAGRRALILEPDSAPSLLNLGCAQGAASDAPSAGRSLRRALRLEPRNADALAQLGRTLEGAGDGAAAEPLLRRALAASPNDAETWASLGRLLLGRGAPERAEAAARRALRLRADLPSGLALLGRALAATGRDIEALAAYDRVISAAPGLGAGFSGRALLLLRRAFGPPPAPRPRGAGPRLAVSRLGSAGRFGNQILQYGYARILAERLGLELETPDWIGRALYGLDDPYPSGSLPVLDEAALDIAALLQGRDSGACADRDLTGYFCGNTAPLAPSRELFRALFTPAGPFADRGAAALAGLRARGRTLVALHLRRGDFAIATAKRFWIAPEAWYLDWLAALWPRLDRPVLFIASDAPEVAARFAAYAPMSAADLGEPIPGAEFFIDHWILAHADMAAVSNSSFSVTAAMLNPRARLFVRPDRRQGGLVPFDPWDAPVLLD